MAFHSIDMVLLGLVVFFPYAAANVMHGSRGKWYNWQSPTCSEYCRLFDLGCPKQAADISAQGVNGTPANFWHICLSRCENALQSEVFPVGNAMNFADEVSAWWSNTLQCRVNHLAMAAHEVGMPHYHCEHGSLTGSMGRCDGTNQAEVMYELWKHGRSLFYRDAEIDLETGHFLAGIYYLSTMRSRLMVNHVLWADEAKYGLNPHLLSDGASLPATYCSSKSRFRQADGTCNNLGYPLEGSLGTNFTRMTMKSEVDYANELPHPSRVAAALKRRKPLTNNSVTDTWFNQLSVAWIHFMTHDWFQHDISNPNKHANKVTHWWDASQIYGSGVAGSRAMERMRDPDDPALLRLDAASELDYDEHGSAQTGFTDNWWAGLHVMHTIWHREHNWIVGQLRSHYPAMTDTEELYGLARLIVSAVLAKIHTLEWTTAILPNKIASVSANVNWYGLDKTPEILGLNVSALPPMMQGIMDGLAPSLPVRGSKSQPAVSFNTPSQITEELISVSRMHPLLPDALIVQDDVEESLSGSLVQTEMLATDIKSMVQSSTKAAETSSPNRSHVSMTSRTHTLMDMVFRDTRRLEPKKTTSLFMKALGSTRAQPLRMRNYPEALYNLSDPNRNNGKAFSVAEMDIIRDRERGLPLYNDAREQLGLPRLKDFADLTSDIEEQNTLQELYGTVDKVDLLVGTLADQSSSPGGFGFGLVPYHVLITMASKRVLSDRFFMQDYRAEYYTEWGMEYLEKTRFYDVLARHFPHEMLGKPKNVFYVWPEGEWQAQGETVSSQQSENVTNATEGEPVSSAMSHLPSIFDLPYLLVIVLIASMCT